jgi:hypothetical protein
MDLSTLATKDTADTGEWFTVELYGKEQDFQLKILGDDSDAVSDYLKGRIKKTANRTEKKKLTDEDIDDVVNMDKENVLVRLAGIRGLKRDEAGKIVSYDEPVVWEDREIKNTPTDYAFIIDNIPEIKTFVLRVSKDRTNFLSQGKKNLKEPSADSSS